MAKLILRTVDNFRQYNEKLKNLKKQYEDAIKDEDQASKMYSGLINQAQDINYSNGELKVCSIRDQELYHAEIYKKLIREIDGIIANNEKEIKRLDEEERRKRLGEREGRKSFEKMWS